ncbi:hypothetical protein FQZ97_1108860 [compost metagenome]
MVEDESLQCLDVGYQDLQQVVRIPCHQIALHHFWPLGDRSFEALQGVFYLFLQAHVDEHVDVQPKQLWSQQGHLLANQSELLHCFDSIEAGGWRQVQSRSYVARYSPASAGLFFSSRAVRSS